MNKDIKSDIVFSIVLLGIVAVLYWQIIPTQISVPSMIKSPYLSPAFIPRVFTLYIGVMAVILLLTALAEQKRNGPGKDPGPDEKKATLNKTVKELLLVFTIWLVCVLYIGSIYIAGIIIPSALLLGILMYFFGQKRRAVIVSILIIVPLILYLFFHGLANVSFPKGILFG
jgi:asparagine N-glycosylation enzyme membrane subunit Stt3